MYIPCPQTENQNNFRQGTLENDWTSDIICNIIHDIRVRTWKECGILYHNWSSPRNEHLNLLVRIKFLHLFLYSSKQKLKIFTGLGPDDRCSSYSLDPFLHTDVYKKQVFITLHDQTLLSLIENIKVGHIPFTLSINSFYFNQSILILIKVQNWYLPLRQHLSMSCYHSDQS
jgi:hypothetical protein